MNFGKLFDAIKGPALAAASTLIPGGPVILSAVNAMLPEDEKLPEAATGQQIVDKVNSLPADQRASLMEKQLDVDIAEITAWERIQASLAVADTSGASTRPYIAMMMAWLVVIETAVIVFVLAVAIWQKDDTTLTVLQEFWPLLLALIGTPTALLRAYFGMRTNEKKARYSAATGQDLTGGIVGLIKAFKH